MIGTFSFNEKENLRRILEAIEGQSRGFDRQIVVYDESNDGVTPGIAREFAQAHPSEVVLPPGPRVGKVPHENMLAERFLNSGQQFLLHFDADLELGPGCIPRLVKSLEGGMDMVTSISLSSPGSSYFERAVRVLNRPQERSREVGEFRLPLVGHTGAYSRRAVKAIFPFPEGGFNEEIFALLRAKGAGLSYAIEREATTRFRLVDNLVDFISYRRRVAASEILLEKACGPPVEAIVAELEATPALRHLASAIREDPAAALLAPYLLAVRIAATHSSRSTRSDAWSPLASTKRT